MGETVLQLAEKVMRNVAAYRGLSPDGWPAAGHPA